MCAYWSNAPHSFWNLHRSATSTDMFCKYCFGRPRCRWKSDCFHQLPRKLWQPRRRLRPLCPHPLTSNRGFPTHPSSESSDLSAQGFWPPCRRHERHPPQARMYQALWIWVQTAREHASGYIRHISRFVHSRLLGLTRISDRQFPLFVQTPIYSEFFLPDDAACSNHA